MRRLRSALASRPIKRAAPCITRVALALSWLVCRFAICASLQNYASDRNVSQFAHGSDMAEQLLKTGTRQLVEGNTWNDDYWCVRRSLQLKNQRAQC